MTSLIYRGKYLFLCSLSCLSFSQHSPTRNSHVDWLYFGLMKDYDVNVYFESRHIAFHCGAKCDIFLSLQWDVPETILQECVRVIKIKMNKTYLKIVLFILFCYALTNSCEIILGHPVYYKVFSPFTSLHDVYNGVYGKTKMYRYIIFADIFTVHSSRAHVISFSMFSRSRLLYMHCATFLFSFSLAVFSIFRFHDLNFHSSITRELQWSFVGSPFSVFVSLFYPPAPLFF